MTTYLCLVYFYGILHYRKKNIWVAYTTHINDWSALCHLQHCRHHRRVVIVSIVGTIVTMDVVILLKYYYIFYNISHKSMFHILPYPYIIIHEALQRMTFYSHPLLNKHNLILCGRYSTHLPMTTPRRTRRMTILPIRSLGHLLSPTHARCF